MVHYLYLKEITFCGLVWAEMKMISLKLIILNVKVIYFYCYNVFLQQQLLLLKSAFLKQIKNFYLLIMHTIYDWVPWCLYAQIITICTLIK